MAFPRHPSLQCAKRLQRYPYRRSTPKWRIFHLIFWFMVSYMLNHICTNTYTKPLGWNPNTFFLQHHLSNYIFTRGSKIDSIQIPSIVTRGSIPRSLTPDQDDPDQDDQDQDDPDQDDQDQDDPDQDRDDPDQDEWVLPTRSVIQSQ